MFCTVSMHERGKNSHSKWYFRDVHSTKSWHSFFLALLRPHLLVVLLVCPLLGNILGEHSLALLKPAERNSLDNVVTDQSCPAE